MIARTLFIVTTVLLSSSVQASSSSVRRTLYADESRGVTVDSSASSSSIPQLSATVKAGTKEYGKQDVRPNAQRQLFFQGIDLDWLWDLLRAIFSFEWLFPNRGHNGADVLFTNSTVCCDPEMRPDGLNNRPLCFEGSTCCTDGNWTCNAGDASSICAKDGEACPAPVISPPVDAPVEAPVTAPVASPP